MKIRSNDKVGEEDEEEEEKEDLEGAYITSEESSFHPIKPYQHSVPPRHLF